MVWTSTCRAWLASGSGGMLPGPKGLLKLLKAGLRGCQPHVGARSLRLKGEDALLSGLPLEQVHTSRYLQYIERKSTF